jgi:hypothetical protein
MAKKGAVDSDTQILSECKDGMTSWGSAVDAHKQAPPDRGFAARLAALAQGERGGACLSSDRRRGLCLAARASGAVVRTS